MTTNTIGCLALTAVLGLGCAGFGCAASPGIDVGAEPDGSVAGTGGVSGIGGGGFGGSDGNALVAHVEEPPSAMAIEIVTIGCDGECADVIAVASGGNAPYTFVWNDGVTTAARQLCAIDTTTFNVSAQDTAIAGPEFPYEAQTVIAEVTAQVIECPTDGGVPVDASAGDLCFDNPSFEGTPGVGPFRVWDVPWTDCSIPYGAWSGVVNETVGPNPGVTFPSAIDGSTYATIQASYQGGPLLPSGLGQPLCAEAVAALANGNALSFTFEARAWSLPTDTSIAEMTLEVLGGSAVCSAAQAIPHTDVLWTSPPLTTTWTSYCATIETTAPTSALTFSAGRSPASGGAWILLDHIVPVAACP